MFILKVFMSCGFGGTVTTNVLYNVDKNSKIDVLFTGF